MAADRPTGVRLTRLAVPQPVQPPGDDAEKRSHGGHEHGYGDPNDEPGVEFTDCF